MKDGDHQVCSQPAPTDATTVTAQKQFKQKLMQRASRRGVALLVSFRNTPGQVSTLRKADSGKSKTPHREGDAMRQGTWERPNQWQWGSLSLVVGVSP
jgi:hypothetical protein